MKGLTMGHTSGKPKRAPKKPPKCDSVVHTHDGGYTWEGACACGWKSKLTPQKGVAERALKGHEKA